MESVMSRNKEKNDLITKERKEEILLTATKIFAQKGYQGTNISDIAKELNISQGIIFWYFETKENLFKIAFREEFKAIKFAAAAILSDRHLTPGEKLQKLIPEMLKVYYEKKDGCMLILQLLSNKDMQKMLSIDILNVYEELYRDLENLFKEAGSGNPGMKARNFVALLDGFMIQIILGLDLDNYKTLVKDILQRYEII
jgi:AcrR family transcriptional regulator